MQKQNEADRQREGQSSESLTKTLKLFSIEFNGFAITFRRKN